MSERVGVEMTAQEIAQLSDADYAKAIWALGSGLKIWRINHESENPRDCPPCPSPEDDEDDE